MSLRISAITGTRNPILMVQNKAKSVAKGMKNANTDCATKLTYAMAMMMPAGLFLDSGIVHKDDRDYEKIGDQWYEKHYPMDDSDYPYSRPCEDPFKQENKYPIS